MISSNKTETFSEGKPESHEHLASELEATQAALAEAMTQQKKVSDLRTHLQDVIDFHDRFGLSELANDIPYTLDNELLEFRANFMQEELNEYCEANGLVMNEEGKWVKRPGVQMVNLEKALDGLIDLAYVLYGTVHLHGFRGIWQAAWDAVHQANMQKVRVERADDSKRGSTFDVVKPEGWQPPNLSSLLGFEEPAIKQNFDEQE